MNITYYNCIIFFSWFFSILFAGAVNNGLLGNECSFAIKTNRIINLLLFLFPYKKRISLPLYIIQPINVVSLVITILSVKIFDVTKVAPFFGIFAVIYSLIAFGVIVLDLGSNPV